MSFKKQAELAQAQFQPALPEKLDFISTWVDRVCGPLKPYPVQLLTVEATPNVWDKTGPRAAALLRRFRQETIAICQVFGGQAHAYAGNRIAAYWPGKQSDTPNNDRCKAAHDALRSNLKMDLCLTISIVEVAVETNLDQATITRHLSKLHRRGHSDDDVTSNTLAVDDDAQSALSSSAQNAPRTRAQNNARNNDPSSKHVQKISEQLARLCTEAALARGSGTVLLCGPIGVDKGRVFADTLAAWSTPNRIAINLDLAEPACDLSASPASGLYRQLMFSLFSASAAVEARRQMPSFNAWLEDRIGVLAAQRILGELVDDPDFAETVGPGAAVSLTDALEQFLAATARDCRMLIGVDLRRGAAPDGQDFLGWISKVASRLPGLAVLTVQHGPPDQAQTASVQTHRVLEINAPTTAQCLNLQTCDTMPPNQDLICTDSENTCCVPSLKLAGGRPRLAREIAIRAACEGAIAPDTVPAVTTRNIAAVIPISLSGMFEHPSSTARLACALAVLQHGFLLSDAARLLSMTEQQIAPFIRNLCLQGVLSRSVSASGLTYRFSCDLVRAAAFLRVPQKGQFELHRIAAHTISQLLTERPVTGHEKADLLHAAAVHYENSGQERAACEHWLMAGQAFAALRCRERAADAYTSALELNIKLPTAARKPGELETRLALARQAASLDMGTSRKLVSGLTRCLKLVTACKLAGSHHHVETLVRLCEVLRARGSLNHSATLLDALRLAAAERIDVSEKIAVDITEFLHAWHVGDFTTALEHSDRIQQLTRDAGFRVAKSGLRATAAAQPMLQTNSELSRLNAQRAALSLATLGVIKAFQNQPRASNNLIDTAVRVADQIGHPVNQARVLTLAATQAWFLGNTSSTTSLAMAAQAIARNNRFPIVGATAQMFLAAASTDRYDVDAVEDIAGAIATFEDLNAGPMVVLGEYLQAQKLAETARNQSAQAAIRRAIRAANAAGFQAYQVELERLEIEITFRLQPWTNKSLRSRLERLLARADAQGALLFVTRIAQTLGEIDIGHTGNRHSV